MCSSDLWRGGDAGQTDVRSLSTNNSDGYLRWRYGSTLLPYRAIQVDNGAVVIRARRRGPATELIVAATLGVSDDSADRATARAARAIGADYALRLGRSAYRRGFIPLPGGGPALTWRAVDNPGSPPLSNWAVSLGDMELF